MILGLLLAACKGSRDIKGESTSSLESLEERGLDSLDEENITEEREESPDTPINNKERVDYDESEDLDMETSDKDHNNSTTSPTSSSKKEDGNIGGRKEEKKEDKKSPAYNPQETKEAKVTIKIVGPEPVGSILGETEVVLKEGDTVFDILAQVTKGRKIHLDYRGRRSSVYVQGISNIYEFDHGPESGWIYRVNGKVSQTSSGAYKLKDGDKIEWLYTTQLGREFENKGGAR